MMIKGEIVIKLDEYLKEHKISRNKLAKQGDLRYDTILSYCRGEVTRLDTDTLKKICSALECDLTDIIEFKKT